MIGANLVGLLACTLRAHSPGANSSNMRTQSICIMRSYDVTMLPAAEPTTLDLLRI